MQKRFFSGCTFAWFYDIFSAPESFSTIDNTYPGYNIERNGYTGVAIASCAFDLRLNLVDFNDKASFSFNFPITPGLGVAKAGFGNVYFPFMLQYNYGYHSTFNNIDHKGFTVGAGYMLIMYPIFHGDSYPTKTWSDVVVKAGYKTDSRKLKNFELMVGTQNGLTIRFGFGLIFDY